MNIVIVDDNSTNLVVLKALSNKLAGNQVHTFRCRAMPWPGVAPTSRIWYCSIT